MRLARPVALSPDQKVTLEECVLEPNGCRRTALRAQIILLAAKGLHNQQIANQLHISPEKAARWRARFIQGGVEAIRKDLPRSGRRPNVTDTLVQDILNKTTRERPEGGGTWSGRKMARATGFSERTIRRIWRRYHLRPHCPESIGSRDREPGAA